MLAALGLFAVSAATARSEEHRFGPLPVTEAWLGSGSGFLSLPVEAPLAPESEAAEAHRWRVVTSLGVSSFWLRSPAVSEAVEARTERAAVTAEELDTIAPWPGFEGIYFADAEVHRLTVDARRRLGSRLELGVRASVVDSGGGLLDPLIEGFHDLFGFRQSGRPQTLQGDYGLYFRRDGPGGYGEQLRFVRFDDPGPGFGETVVSLKSALGRLAVSPVTHAPARGLPRSHADRAVGHRHGGRGLGQWRQAVLLQLKLPTANQDDFHGTGAIDAALQYAVSRKVRRWTLYGNVGFTRLGSHDLLTLEPQNIVTIGLAGERKTGPKSSIVLQLRHQQSPFRQLNLSILGVTATLIDIGWTRSLGVASDNARRAAFLSITNNTAKYGSAVDLSLHAGIRLDFGSLPPGRRAASDRSAVVPR